MARPELPAGYQWESAQTKPALPDGYSWEQPAAPTQATPATPAIARPSGFVDSAVAGFKRSMPETKSLLYGAGAAVAGAVGADGIRDKALDAYTRIQKDEVAPLQGESSFLGSLKGETSFGDWAGDTLGNFGGQALQSLAAAGAGALVGGAAGTAVPGAGNVVGGVGGAVAGAIARPLVKKAVGKKIAEMVAEGATKQAVGQAALKRAGMIAAPAALNIAQETGIGFTGRAEDAQKSGEQLNQTDAMRAIGYGVPAGLIDTAAEALVAGRLLKGSGTSPSMVKRVAGGAAKGAATEGGTEGVQAVLERAGAARDLTGKDAYTDYIENVAAGALGGGVAGGASGVRGEQQDQPQPQENPTAADPATTVAQPATPDPFDGNAINAELDAKNGQDRAQSGYDQEAIARYQDQQKSAIRSRGIMDGTIPPPQKQAADNLRAEAQVMDAQAQTGIGKAAAMATAMQADAIEQSNPFGYQPPTFGYEAPTFPPAPNDGRTRLAQQAKAQGIDPRIVLTLDDAEAGELDQYDDKLLATYAKGLWSDLQSGRRTLPGYNPQEDGRGSRQDTSRPVQEQSGLAAMRLPGDAVPDASSGGDAAGAVAAEGSGGAASLAGQAPVQSEAAGAQAQGLTPARAPLSVRMGGNEYPVESYEDASTKFRQLRDTVDIGGMPAVELIDQGGNPVGYIGQGGEVYEGSFQEARLSPERKAPVYQPPRGEALPDPNVIEGEASRVNPPAQPAPAPRPDTTVGSSAAAQPAGVEAGQSVEPIPSAATTAPAAGQALGSQSSEALAAPVSGVASPSSEGGQGSVKAAAEGSGTDVPRAIASMSRSQRDSFQVDKAEASRSTPGAWKIVAEAATPNDLNPERAAYQLAKFDEGVKELDGQFAGKSRGASSEKLVSVWTQQGQLRTAIAQSRAANPEMWAAYDARQAQVAALKVGDRVNTAFGGSGVITRKFGKNWRILDDDGIQSLQNPVGLTPVSKPESKPTPKKPRSAMNNKELREAEAEKASATNKPLAVEGLTSYRYQGRYGPVMIGAKDSADALKQAERSISGKAMPDKLEVWNGTEYVADKPQAETPQPASKYAKYDEAAKEYGRSVRSDGAILKGGKESGLFVREKGKRLRIEDKDGKLTYSGAPNGEALGKFMESFWFAEKKPAAPTLGRVELTDAQGRVPMGMVADVQAATGFTAQTMTANGDIARFASREKLGAWSLTTELPARVNRAIDVSIAEDGTATITEVTSNRRTDEELTRSERTTATEINADNWQAATTTFLNSLKQPTSSQQQATQEKSDTLDGQMWDAMSEGQRDFLFYEPSWRTPDGRNVQAKAKNYLTLPWDRLSPDVQAKLVAAYELREAAHGRRPAPTTDRKDAGDVLESVEADEPFFSAALRAVEEGKGAPKRGAYGDWRGWLDGAVRRGDMKQSERDWLGIDAYLSGRDTTTRQELADFIRANEVKVEEVTLGGETTEAILERTAQDLFRTTYDALTDAAQQQVREEAEANEDSYGTAGADATKFNSYQLPGGENYRELLLTLPPNEPSVTKWMVFFPNGNPRQVVDTEQQAEREAKSIGGRYEKVAPKDTSGTFRSSHFDQPNILAHVRFNERVDSDGKKVLFIEEIQSDWHQAGRKRGYGSSHEIVEQGGKFRIRDKRSGEFASTEFGPMEFSERKWAEQQMASVESKSDIPDAPFKATDEWAMLAFKRMVRVAAEGGFDRIAWTTGEQQAERYDLSKQVREVHATKERGGWSLTLMGLDGRFINQPEEMQSVGNDRLADVVGKELAEKIIAESGEEVPDAMPNTRVYRGEALKVGGSGMKGFYDRILPSAVNKWAKRFGGKVGQSNIDASTPQISTAAWKREPRLTTVHAIDLTPAMRDAALQGQPLFSIESETLADTDLTPAERASFNRQRAYGFKGSDVGITDNERSALEVLEREESRANGIEDADKLGLRKAVNSVIGSVFGLPPIQAYYLRGKAGLDGIATPAYIKKLEDQQKGRDGKMRTAGLYLRGEDAVGGKPVFVLFTDVSRIPWMAAFTAAHEVAGHHGLHVLLGKRLRAVLREAVKNQTVRKVADSMYVSRKFGEKVAKGEMTAENARYLAIEEALADLAAANATGNWQRIQDKHGVTPSKEMQSKLRAFIANVVRQIKMLFKTRNVGFSDAQVQQLLGNAFKAAQGQSASMSVMGANGALEQVVFHGTPHTVDKFSLNKIGTGEGAQAFGYGLYFASQKEIAEHYRDVLSGIDVKLKSGANEELADDYRTLENYAPSIIESVGRMLADSGKKATLEYIEATLPRLQPMPREAWGFARNLVEADAISAKRTGNLYRVDVPEDADLLDWDKPLSEQPEKVREAIERGGRYNDGLRMALGRNLNAAATGQSIYQALSRQLGGPQKASERLLDLGVVGLRYLDGGSRGQGQMPYQDGLPAGFKYEKDQSGVGIKNEKGLWLTTGHRSEADAHRNLFGPKPSHNYVIWDESAIGQPQSALESTEGGSLEGVDSPVAAWAKQKFGDRVAPDGKPVWQNFVDWFGKKGLVNEDGTPKPVYHGTNAADFTEFKMKDGRFGRGAYFWGNKEKAQEWAENVVKNGVMGDRRKAGGTARVIEAYVRDAVEAAGDVFVVGRKQDIKLADENSGNFSNNPSILESVEAFTLSDNPTPADLRIPGEITLDPLHKAGVKGILARIGKKFTDLKPQALALVPLQEMDDFTPKTVQKDGTTVSAQPSVATYIQLQNDMQAMRNTLYVDYDKTAQDLHAYSTKGAGIKGFFGKAVNQQGRDLFALMHDSTIAGVDPSEQNVRYKDPGKAAKYRDLQERYNKIPKEGQDLFKAVRDAYAAQTDLLDEVIEANATRAAEITTNRARRKLEDREREIREDGSLNALEKAKASAAAKKAYDDTVDEGGTQSKIAALRKMLESNRVPKPYFPLKRYGKYWVSVLKDGKLAGFSKFETAAEQSEFSKSMVAQGHQTRLKYEGDAAQTREMIDPKFVADVEEILTGLPNEIRDEVWQAYLERMPDMSLRKSFIHRKNVAGYHFDALKAFGSTLFHGSHQIARLKYGMEMAEAIDLAKEQANALRESDPEGALAADMVAAELDKRHAFIMNPTNAKWAQKVSGAAFMYSLGANPAHLFLNATQTVMLGVPILGTRYGFGRASKALTKAARDFAKGKGHLEKANLTADELRAFRDLQASGIIEKSQAHDIAGIGAEGVEYDSVRKKVMDKIGWFMHQSERFNREVTAMAAYRLSRQDGRSHDAAMAEASKQVYQIHFDYSNAARARVMQGDMAKALLVFRNYQANMIYRLFRDIHQSIRGESPQVKREARKQLGAIMGMYGLFAGTMGVPFYGLAMALAGAFDDEDDPVTAEQQFVNGTVEFLGPTAAKVLLRGIPGTLFDVDLTERIGMGNLWFRSPQQEMEGRDAYYYWMEQLLGAGLAPVKGVFDGINLAMQGQIQRGIERAAPAALRNPLQSIRMAQEGGVTSLDGDLIKEVNGGDLLTKALGFQPLSVSEQYEKNNEIKGADRRLSNRRQRLLNRYFLAIQMGDDTAEQMADIQAFNLKNPEYAITRDTIQRSARLRNRNSANSENGIVMTRRMRRLQERMNATEDDD